MDQDEHGGYLKSAEPHPHPLSWLGGAGAEILRGRIADHILIHTIRLRNKPDNAEVKLKEYIPIKKALDLELTPGRILSPDIQKVIKKRPSTAAKQRGFLSKIQKYENQTKRMNA